MEIQAEAGDARGHTPERETGMAAEHDVRQCFCLHLRRSARQVTQFYDGRLQPSGLRVTQFTLLATIERLRPRSQRPLAEMMGMDRTTLTRNLALLERDGYLKVEEAKQDRRERMIRLTKAGRDALAEAMPLWQLAQAEFKRRLSEEMESPGFEQLLGVVDKASSVAMR